MVMLHIINGTQHLGVCLNIFYLQMYTLIFGNFGNYVFQRHVKSCLHAGGCPNLNISSLQSPVVMDFFTSRLAAPTIEFASSAYSAQVPPPPLLYLQHGNTDIHLKSYITKRKHESFNFHTLL